MAILLCFFTFINCKKDRRPDPTADKGILEARVFLSAGEVYPPFSTMDVPTFFNIGKVNSNSKIDVNTIILGKKKSKGIKLSVHPIALLSFEKDSVEYKYIVSVAAENRKIEFEYNSFLLNNYIMQATIENWFKSQCPLHSCKEFNWSNTYKALLEIK